jgi:hypothetical protein
MYLNKQFVTNFCKIGNFYVSCTLYMYIYILYSIKCFWQQDINKDVWMLRSRSDNELYMIYDWMFWICYTSHTYICLTLVIYYIIIYINLWQVKEKVTFWCMRLLNRGDRMDMFDCIYIYGIYIKRERR